MIALMIALASRPGIAQPSDVDAVVHGFMLSRHIPGMVVGIERHGATLMLRGYGVADREHPRPVTPNRRFEIGSINVARRRYPRRRLEQLRRGAAHPPRRPGICVAHATGVARLAVIALPAGRNLARFLRVLKKR